MAAKNRGISEQHRRTRRDHSMETAEDYVEAVAQILAAQERCRIVDLARRFDVSHVTVTKIIARLQRDGLVETVPYGPITLTRRGQNLAEQSRQRHEVVYRFLISIGVPERTAAIDAEGIEHHVSPETLEKMRQAVEQSAEPKPAFSSSATSGT